ncbi:MAG TPA: hypothetical protein VFA18_08835 [Gemmataceae bacterium]|nr:hypothetical protein [Gemmataceae bacterium]
MVRKQKGDLFIAIEWLARFPALKWVVGPFLFLLAAAVFLVALGCYFTYKSDGERGPREVTADELRNLTSLKQLPDPWIAYTFPDAAETDVRLGEKSFSLGEKSFTKHRAYSRFILVQVEDCWVAAEVPPDFTGNKIVGKVEELGSWDGTTDEKNLSSKIISQIRESNPDKADRILGYQVNAVLPYESRTRSGYLLAGGIAFVGLILGSLGLTIVRTKPLPR